MAAADPATVRGGSMSSIRTSHSPARVLASRKLATAAIREPACSGPEGEGAKRPRYTRVCLLSSGTAELLLLDLVEGLAVDAFVGGWSCFETAYADLDTAGIAIAV